MGKHAILSPSGAHRWMNCPGAPAMEQGQPDSGGAYADEGTAAHFLASECLNHNCDPVQYLNRKIVVGVDAEADTDGAQWAGEEETGFDQRQEYEVDGDLISNVRTYCNNVRQYADGNVLMVEFALPIGHLTGEEGATGTGDVVIVADEGEELQLHDLKYGHRHVSPEQNEQLMLYGLGALEAVKLVGYEPKRVRLVIHQPRVFDAPGEWSLTLDELLQFGEKVKERARHSMACFKELPGALVHHLRPSEEACQWCRAKAVCPKLARFIEETVGAEFDEIVEKIVVEEESEKMIVAEFEGIVEKIVEETARAEFEEIVPVALGTAYPPEELAVKMAACNLIESWIKAIRARVESELLEGREVSGYKLVAGRKGARQWASNSEAEQLLKSFRLKKEEMYNFKLISPTSAEKLLKKDSPKRWTKLQDAIVQKDGRVSVAPASDPRQEWKPEPVEDDFDNMSGGDLV